MRPSHTGPQELHMVAYEHIGPQLAPEAPQRLVQALQVALAIPRRPESTAAACCRAGSRVVECREDRAVVGGYAYSIAALPPRGHRRRPRRHIIPAANLLSGIVPGTVSLSTLTPVSLYRQN